MNAFADASTFQLFTTMFLSVLIGVFPFLLVAALAAGIIEVFVSRRALMRILPRNPVLGVLVAPLIGFLIPLCECGVIPIAGRLMRKGVPTAVAIAFMLANPILNPFPLYSTLLAFPFQTDLAVMRMVGAYFVAVFVGLIVMFVYKQKPALVSSGMTLTEGAIDRALDREVAAGREDPVPFSRKVLTALQYAGNEFYNIGRFFIVGASLAAAVNVWVPRSTLMAIGSTDLASIPTMMGFAFLLSICSEADAFVAASFSATFSMGSLLAFMVYGPMVDVKNTLMMLATFKRSMVFLLIGLITPSVFVLGLLTNMHYVRLLDY